MTASATTDTRHDTVQAALDSLARKSASTEEADASPFPPGHFTNLAARKAAEDAERFRTERES